MHGGSSEDGAPAGCASGPGRAAHRRAERGAVLAARALARLHTVFTIRSERILECLRLRHRRPQDVGVANVGDRQDRRTVHLAAGGAEGDVVCEQRRAEQRREPRFQTGIKGGGGRCRQSRRVSHRTRRSQAQHCNPPEAQPVRPMRSWRRRPHATPRRMAHWMIAYE